MNLILKHALIDYPEPQYRVAQKIGVAHTTISKFIAEIQKPSSNQKKKLAKILGKRESELFPAEQLNGEESLNG